MAPVAVKLVVHTPSELLDRHYPNGRLGGLALDGVCAAAVGDAVELTIEVRKPKRTFAVRGQLAWARRKGSATLAQSFGVDFAPDDAGVARLLAVARRELDEATLRNEARQAVELPVRLVHGGIARKETLADVSHGGAFVRTWNPLEVGQVVELSVRPPRTLFSIQLKARVAWVRRAGPDTGMGLSFLDMDGGLQKALLKLFTKLGLG